MVTYDHVSRDTSEKFWHPQNKIVESITKQDFLQKSAQIRICSIALQPELSESITVVKHQDELLF